MTDEIIVLLLIGAAAALWIMWRESRRARWNEGGRCYQCGKALGFDFKTITRRYKGGSTKRVDFCARCMRHRLVWGWLVSAVVVVFVALMWYHVSHAG